MTELHYIKRLPKVAIENPPLMVMLHGYGSHEQDLFSFAEELPDEFLIISVQAPLSIAFGGYAWYSIHFNATDASKFSDIPEAKEALKAIDHFLEKIKHEYSYNQDKVFLLGFSQGTILSMAYALNHPDKVNYVVGLSGYINEELIGNTTFKQYQGLEMFISHGTVDQVIPVTWARQTSPFLKQLGIVHEYHEYPVGHGVAPQNFYDFKQWVSQRI